MDQDVEYDSVADLRGPVSDDEYSDSFADDMMEVPSPGTLHRAPPGKPALPSVSSRPMMPWVCLQRHRDHRAIV